MPTVQPKSETMSAAAAASREAKAKAILRSFFLGVTNYVLLLPAELQLTSKILGGDMAETSRMLALTGGLSGLVEFLLNPTFGKMSDAFGRRPFFLIGPAYVCLGNALLATSTSSTSASRTVLTLVVVNSFLRKVSGTVSGSVASVTALNDISSGRDFAIYISKLWAFAGAGVVCAPLLSGYIENYFGPRAVYAAASIGGLAQFVHNYMYIPETLAVAKTNGDSNDAPSGKTKSQTGRSLADMVVNPLRCFDVLTSSGSLLRTAVLASVFASFVEGKNMSTTNSLYLRNEIGLSPLVASRHTVLYGIAMYLSGKYWVPALLKFLGPSRFTTIANALNLLGFYVYSRARTSRDLVLALTLLFTGINANSASALKAIASDAAAKRGFGRGLYNGHVSNLRALVTTWAPLVYGGIYARALRSKRHPGMYVYGAAMLLGCVVPELLHRSLPENAVRWKKRENASARKKCASGG